MVLIGQLSDFIIDIIIGKMVNCILFISMHLLSFRFKVLGYFLHDERPEDDGKVLLFPHYSVVHCLINAPSPVEKETN